MNSTAVGIAGLAAGIVVGTAGVSIAASNTSPGPAPWQTTACKLDRHHIPAWNATDCYWNHGAMSAYIVTRRSSGLNGLVRQHVEQRCVFYVHTRLDGIASGCWTVRKSTYSSSATSDAVHRSLLTEARTATHR